MKYTYVQLKEVGTIDRQIAKLLINLDFYFTVGYLLRLLHKMY